MEWDEKIFFVRIFPITTNIYVYYIVVRRSGALRHCGRVKGDGFDGGTKNIFWVCRASARRSSRAPRRGMRKFLKIHLVCNGENLPKTPFFAKFRPIFERNSDHFMFKRLIFIIFHHHHPKFFTTIQMEWDEKTFFVKILPTTPCIYSSKEEWSFATLWEGEGGRLRRGD